MEEMPPEEKPRFEDVYVLDTAGRPVWLPSLWAERPIVLALVRHFG